MYYRAVVCRHGHTRTATLQPGYDYDTFCEECGEPTIVACENCNTALQGLRYGFVVRWTPPQYCRGCATPYPWTLWKAEQLKAAIATYAEGNLSAGETEDLQQFADEAVSGNVSEPRIKSRVAFIIARLGPAAKAILDGVVDMGTSAVAKVTVEAMKAHGLM